MAGSSKGKGRTVAKDDDREITTASSLARIEAKLDIFKENLIRHEANDLTVAQRTDGRLDTMERRNEERATDLQRSGEKGRSELASSVANQLNGVSAQFAEV